MSADDPEETELRSYPADRLFNILSRDPYTALGALWEKAVGRVDEDPAGAVTLAKSLLEAACKVVLEKTLGSFDNDADLPKLYSEASKALDIAPKQQTDQTYRSIFGAVHTIVQSVGEIRNKVGDAHGNHKELYHSSISEAELAVNLTGSIVLFLLSTLESYLTLKKRIGSDGRIILRFETTMIWRLVDHARNAPVSMPYYDQETGPALWLVGDTGIYLMSNGSPRIGRDGLLVEPGTELKNPSLIVHAEGCDPTLDEFERWWKIHGGIDEGSDFCIPIDVQTFIEVLPESDRGIFIIVGNEEYVVYPDSEFKRVFGAGSL